MAGALELESQSTVRGCVSSGPGPGRSARAASPPSMQRSSAHGPVGFPSTERLTSYGFLGVSDKTVSYQF